MHPTTGERARSSLAYASKPNPEYFFLFLTHPAWFLSASSSGWSLKAESSHEQERTFNQPGKDVSTSWCSYMLLLGTGGETKAESALWMCGSSAQHEHCCWSLLNQSTLSNGFSKEGKHCSSLAWRAGNVAAAV